MKVLMVLTSHDQLGNTGRKTGFWLEEFAAPYFTFLDAGATITVASPKGGQPPGPTHQNLAGTGAGVIVSVESGDEIERWDTFGQPRRNGETGHGRRPACGGGDSKVFRGGA